MADERTKLDPPINELFLHIARGKIQGWNPVEKFGKRESLPNGSWADLLQGGFDLTYLETAEALFISSSDAGDDQEIEVVGLDENFELQTETVTLAGQTKTEIGSGLTWLRVFRAKNKGASDLAGNVWIYADDTVTGGVPQTDSKKQLFVGPDNQSNHVAFTVPANHTAYLTGFDCTVGRAVAATCKFRLRVRELGGAFQTKRPAELNSAGVADYKYPYKFPIEIPEKSDIIMQAQAGANGMDATGGFQLVYLLND